MYISYLDDLRTTEIVVECGWNGVECFPFSIPVSDDTGRFTAFEPLMPFHTTAAIMRKTVNISMPEEMYRYVVARSGYLPVSEYIRGLITADQLRTSERNQVVRKLRTANESMICGRAVEELRRVMRILEGEEPDLD